MSAVYQKSRKVVKRLSAAATPPRISRQSDCVKKDLTQSDCRTKKLAGFGGAEFIELCHLPRRQCAVVDADVVDETVERFAVVL